MDGITEKDYERGRRIMERRRKAKRQRDATPPHGPITREMAEHLEEVRRFVESQGEGGERGE